MSAKCVKNVNFVSLKSRHRKLYTVGKKLIRQTKITKQEMGCRSLVLVNVWDQLPGFFTQMSPSGCPLQV